MKKHQIDNEIIIYYDINFDKSIFDADLGEHADNWPVTYILYNSSKGKAYVGETTSFKNRMFNHQKDSSKNDYKKALFIDYKYATKSTILHLEAFIIRGLSISHELLSDLSNIKMNSNKHSYYNDDKDEKMCIKVWNSLKDDVGIVNDYYKTIRNKNEFKYSPYILLNENQNEILNEVIDELCSKDNNMIVIDGASGTGKSALAIQLFKQLTNYNRFNGIIDNSMIGESINRLYEIKNKFNNKRYYSIAYVAPMDNFCTIIRNSISKIKGLRRQDIKESGMYINEFDLENLRVYSAKELSHLDKYVNDNKKLFDLIIVDEAQRLNRRYNQSNGNGYLAFDRMNKALGLPSNGTKDDGNQLDWILKISKNQVFFYDKRQTIRSSDIPTKYFDKIFENATYRRKLMTEERCLGGNEYIDYVDSIFSLKPPKKKKLFENYEFQIYDDYDKMIHDLELKDDSLSINASGYFFNDDEEIEIDGIKQVWNQTNKNWINSKKRNKNEIGCIHVLEGVDADYISVIVGDEITYKNGKIDVDTEKYKDKLGKRCVENDDELLQFVSNIYYILLTRSMKGTYLYIKDPKMKAYLEKYINRK